MAIQYIEPTKKDNPASQPHPRTCQSFSPSIAWKSGMNATQANRLKSIFGNARASASPLATHNAARVKELDKFISRFQAAREAGSRRADARCADREFRPPGGTPQPRPCRAQVADADHQASAIRAQRFRRGADFCRSPFLPRL